MTWTIASHAVLFTGAGLALGAVYFYLLKQNVRMFVADSSVFPITLLYVARVVLAVAAFWVAAKSGALALAFTFFGFLVARMCIQLKAGSA